MTPCHPQSSATAVPARPPAAPRGAPTDRYRPDGPMALDGHVRLDCAWWPAEIGGAR